MLIIDSIILGLVQGVTEFLPISSSGHLVIFGHLLNLGDIFVFDVLLNFGTLLALIIYYRKKIWSIIQQLLIGKDWILALKVIAATAPAVIIGLAFSDQIKFLNGSIWVVVVMLLLIGIPMILFGDSNKNADDREIEKSVSWKTAIRIGLAQMIALIPGSSRSGLTIFAGIRNNLSMARAAEFSFLMAIPIIAGASIKMLFSHIGLEFVKNNMSAFIVGNIVSFASGMLAINFLINIVSKRGLKDFGWYRVVLAMILAILLIAGIIS